MPHEHQELIVREHERLACRLDAVLRIESDGVVLSGAAADGPDTVAADVVDFSAGGAGLQTGVFLPRGCRLLLCITPFGPGPGPGAGAVPAWALEAPLRVQRATMIGREPTYYLGAAFLELETPQRAMVDHVLQHLRAAAAQASRTAAAQGAAQGERGVA